MNSDYDSILKDYQGYLELRDYKPRGNEERLRTACSFFDYLRERSMPLVIFRLKDAERYREYLSLETDSHDQIRYSAKTVNCKIAHLRKLFSYLIVSQHITANPFNSVEKLKESDALPKNILDIEQIGRLLKGIRHETEKGFKFKVIVELLYSTGARISEIEGLSRTDIDLIKGYVVIHDDKERQDRSQPLCEYTHKLVSIYLDINKDKTYPFRQGKLRTLNKWVNDQLKKTCIALGLPVITCHGLRHSISCHLLKNGADIREVQSFLGHRRIKNTEIYTRYLTEDLKKVIDKRHPREQQK